MYDEKRDEYKLDEKIECYSTIVRFVAKNCMI